MPLYHKRRKPLLSSTRPHRPSQSLLQPGSTPTTPTLSSAHARTLIRQHHVLQKRLAAARAANNHSLTSALEAQIATLGGLAQYQRASLAGQSKPRGGDSSGVLVRWLYEMMEAGRGAGGEETKKRRGGKCCGWRMLEVGALRVDNAAARSGLFASAERIDLHAQTKGIVTQDFMERPFPTDEEEGFDVVSLSLVLNYVGDAGARGEMLRRVERFLRKRRKINDGDTGLNLGKESKEQGEQCSCSSWLPFPGLFLVLPAPCVTNSRYLDEERLEAMMRGLGYVRAKRKLSLKLVYYFWRWVGLEDESNDEDTHEDDEDCLQHRTKPSLQPSQKPSASCSRFHFPKTELRKGSQRNNFAVVLK